MKKTARLSDKVKGIIQAQKKAKAESAVRHRKKHPEVWAAARKRYRDKFPEKIKHLARAWNYKSKGTTIEEFEQTLAKQNGTCAICFKRLIKSQDRVAEHDHETGQFRGVVCLNCNMAIGHSREDLQILRNIIKYLMKAKKHARQKQGKR